MYLINGQCYESGSTDQAITAGRTVLSFNQRLGSGHIVDIATADYYLSSVSADYIDPVTSSAITVSFDLPYATENQCLFAGNFSHYGAAQFDQHVDLAWSFASIIVIIILGRMVQNALTR